ncbi:hypothetical protein JCM19241_343 [Vibrio ishigakensis]|uniref:Outer membrane protein ompV n=1 Tax=Vibrio ishigakensis TaxID=1481914 RepID=A0A0B8Q8R8_9VIBR|nr:hypothetical protein JCM19241_343 [Vibrio ishigakensis]
MSKLKLLTASIGLAFAASAVAAPVELYIEQNVASNAADDGTYTTEAGATIETSEDGYVYIGFDDQGWLAAGYGYSFGLTDALDLNLYGELGKWETGEELLAEAILQYNINDNFNVFGGYAYNRSGQVIENLSDTSINTNKFIAGTGMTFGMFSLDYTYTHENREGSNGGFTHIGNEYYFSQDSYRTNEHEVILSAQIDDFTPYVKYTYFNTAEGTLFESNTGSNSMPVENDSIWTLGLAYQF